MNKFYFKHRNIGNDPDTNKYYFYTEEELIRQVELLKITTNKEYHIQWSVSQSSFNKNQFSLMSEFWTSETRGTKTPLKCKGWFVCGYIFTDKSEDDIYNIFPEWKADYRNHFIERRYMGSVDFSKLSEMDKEKLNRDGGLILDKFDFGE